MHFIYLFILTYLFENCRASPNRLCLRISHQALIYYCRSCAFPGKESLSLSSVTLISLNIEQSLLFIYFAYIKDSVTVGLGLRDADKQKYDIAITLLHNVLVILNLKLWTLSYALRFK